MLARRQIRREVVKDLRLAQHHERAAHVGRRIDLEQQRRHVRRQQIPSVALLEHLGGERGLAPNTDVERVERGLAGQRLGCDPVRVLSQLRHQSMSEPYLDGAVADVAGQLPEQSRALFLELRPGGCCCRSGHGVPPWLACRYGCCGQPDRTAFDRAFESHSKLAYRSIGGGIDIHRAILRCV